MKRRTIVIYVLLFAAALFLTAYSGSVPKEKPPLQLELVLPKKQFEAGEPIECKAVLTYVGEEDEIKVYLRNPSMIFVVDGGEYMRENQYGWAVHDILNNPALIRVLKKGESVEYPFEKQQYGYYRYTIVADGEEKALIERTIDEEEEAFWEHYRSSSELTLEPGRYRIIARYGYSLEYVTAHGPFEEIVVSEAIIVK